MSVKSLLVATFLHWAEACCVPSPGILRASYCAGACCCWLRVGKAEEDCLSHLFFEIRDAVHPLLVVLDHLGEEVAVSAQTHLRRLQDMVSADAPPYVWTMPKQGAPPPLLPCIHIGAPQTNRTQDSIGLEVASACREGILPLSFLWAVVCPLCSALLLSPLLAASTFSFRVLCNSTDWDALSLPGQFWIYVSRFPFVTSYSPCLGEEVWGARVG